MEVGEEKPTSAPKSPLRKRILYRLFKWCGLTTYNIEQALRNRLWTGIQIGAQKARGTCPYHPGEPLQEREHGYFVCSLCNNALLWTSDVEEPHTDKMHVRQVLFPGRPLDAFNQAIQHGAGPHTAAVQAIPRRTVKLSPDHDRSSK